MRPRSTLAALAPVLAGLGLVAAGCGGASPAAGVASLATSTRSAGSPATSGGTPSGGSAPSGSQAGPHVGFGLGLKTQDAGKFAACMRSHGVPSFPDPNGQGAIRIDPGSGIDPQSPAFQRAQASCRSSLPNGGRPSPAQLAKTQQRLLEFSSCMREHGLTDFPDPVVSNGGIQLLLKGGPGSDLDPRSPKFRAAQAACRGMLPGKLGAGG